MFKYLILTFFLTSHAFSSDDLSSLLNDYEEQSQLHKKTKVESAGHLIIYSRDDLDRMQAHTLNDILKSTRLFSLQETSNGLTGLQRSGATCTNSGCIRLYINNQELSSIRNSSSLMIFKNYNLSLIDHIELYIGGNAVSFGNEYGFVTIRLYTKTPSREQGTMVSLTSGQHGSKKGEFLSAGVLDNNYEYLIYGSKNNNYYDSLYNKNTEIKRYDKISNIYMNVQKKDNFLLEFSNYQTNHDSLFGEGKQKTPTDTFEENIYKYVAYTKFINDIKIQFSYAKENSISQNIDSSGIILSKDYNKTVNTIEKEFNNNVKKFSIINSFKYKDISLLYGIDYQDKNLGLDKLIHDNIDKSRDYNGTTNLKLYSVFLENSYQFNENNLLIATAKKEKYIHNKFDKTDNLYQLRAGLVSLINDNFTLKGFAADNYIYPSLKEFAKYPRVIDGAANLKPIHVNNYSSELIYTKNKHKINIMYMKMVIQDPIKINASKNYFTKDGIVANFYDTSIDYKYTINKNHKVMLQYYETHHNRSFDASPLAGGFIKLMNRYKRFDFYNELVFRKGYTSKFNMKVDDGYDFTSVISYKYSKNFTISLKGENLLNKAISSPVKGAFPVQTTQKKANLRMEIFF